MAAISKLVRIYVAIVPGPYVYTILSLLYILSGKAFKIIIITIPVKPSLYVHFLISLSLEDISAQTYPNAIRAAQHKEHRYALHIILTNNIGNLSIYVIAIIDKISIISEKTTERETRSNARPVLTLIFLHLS